MGFMDAIEREDRVEVKISTVYELMKGCTQAEMMKNGLMHKVAGEDILKVVFSDFDGFHDEEENHE